MNEFFKILGSSTLAAIIALYLPVIRRFVMGPKLELYFGNNIEGCVAKTPIKGIRPGNKGEEFTEVKKDYWEVTSLGYYIRVKVCNRKSVLAKECRAFLINIEKSDENGNFTPTIYCDSIQLQWACRSGQGFNGIDLAKGVNQFIDVLSTQKDNVIIYPKIEMMPFRYEKLFRENGTFRFTIQVSGNEVQPVSLRFIINWKGKWDEIEVDIDPGCLKENRKWWRNIF